MLSNKSQLGKLCYEVALRSTSGLYKLCYQSATGLPYTVVMHYDTIKEARQVNAIIHMLACKNDHFSSRENFVKYRVG